jgi:hypothetical protein
MTEEENQLAHQLFLAGRLHGAILREDTPREIKNLSRQIDPDVLQSYLDKKPEGFLYAEVVQQSIRLARTFKSMSKG